MTNFANQPATARPVWARDVDAGDVLSALQNRCLDHSRLADFGLDTVEMRNGNFRVVVRIAA